MRSRRLDFQVELSGFSSHLCGLRRQAKQRAHRHFPAFETGASAELGYRALELVTPEGFEPSLAGLSTQCLCRIGLRGYKPYSLLLVNTSDRIPFENETILRNSKSPSSEAEGLELAETLLRVYALQATRPPDRWGGVKKQQRK